MTILRIALLQERAKELGADVERAAELLAEQHALPVDVVREALARELEAAQ